jgi:hypothetical protein
MAYNPNDIQWNQPAQPAGQPTTNALVSNPYAGTIGQSSTAAMNTAGYVDNPAGRALYRAGVPAPAPAPQQPPDTSGSDQAALREFFKQTAGFSREELAERARQFNEQMKLTEAQWEREGKPRLQIDQDLQQLRRWQAEQDIALQGRALDLQTEIQRGGLDLQRGQLGLSYLDAASKMGGPSDYFNSVDFFRGASQRGDVPVFLSALGSNTQMPAFQAAGSLAQNPMTAAGLTQKLTGAAPPSMYNADQALAQIGSIFKAGPTSLSRGSLEALDPNELALLKAGGQKLGYDPDQWLRAYGAAGIGQSSAKTY